MKSLLSQLTAALLLCIAAIIAYGAGYAVLSAKSAAVADLESNIRAKTQTANRIAATRTTLASVTNDEAVVRGYFVPETDVVAFIDSLEARGKAQGAAVNVLSVSTGGTTAQPSLLLSLKVKGTFAAVMRTVGAIEYVPYNLSISTLTAVQDAKDSWHADLTLVVGSLPATNEAKNASTPPPAASILTPRTHAFF